MDLKKVKLFFVAFLLIFVAQVNSANAADELGTCVIGTSGTGLDGSDCAAGLLCDPSLLFCTSPTDTACKATDAQGAGCPIGQKCMNGSASKYYSAKGAAGVCKPQNSSSSESNAMGDVVCNVYKLATGKVGRGVVVIVLFVTGISFYLGKVNWGTIVAIVIGAGLCFGGPAIVGILVGKSFLC